MCLVGGLEFESPCTPRHSGVEGGVSSQAPQKYMAWGLREVLALNPGPPRSFPAVQRLGSVPFTVAQTCTPSLFVPFIAFFFFFIKKKFAWASESVSACLPGEGERQVRRLGGRSRGHCPGLRAAKTNRLSRGQSALAGPPWH